MISVGHNPVVALLLALLDLYWWVVVIAVVVSWLVAFGVLNTYNEFARTIIRALAALTEPVFRQIRRVIPPIGGLDLSPLIVLIAIWFLQYVLVWVETKYLYQTV
ncbi:MAG TPA: YggT family protein [Rhizomicrobium sp.]|nr:YggT family protein [Rhizomicrobium sp.]